MQCGCILAENLSAVNLAKAAGFRQNFANALRLPATGCLAH